MNKARPEGSEVKASNARAYGPSVIGCKKFDAAVMVCFTKEDAPTTEQFVDVFMDREQAEQLHRELGAVLQRS